MGPPAKKGIWLQGTSLFCFSVIAWNVPSPKPFWDSESALADNIKKHSLSIVQCDEHAFIDGEQTATAGWGSYNNIDAFTRVWKKVQDDGRWMKHDWIVKVDADAVFFPDRLKLHLDKLRTPRGSRVYLRNIDYEFKFMGALEVLTRQALERYL